jgi:sugar lactone lactonase YvrE
MRARIPATLFLFALIACTADPKVSRPPAAAGDVVVLGTADGALVVSSSSGSVLAEDAGEIAAPDGSRRYASATDGRSTTLETRDPVTGEILASTSIPGELEAGVASISGEAVALLEPGRMSAGGELAPPHRSTTIVVADPSGERAVRTFRLDGNYEPEAFSIDDRRLFLIQYLPALDPTVYRVMTLNLASSQVRPIFGRFKTPPERMPGIRLTQVFDDASDQLYTLYTNEPSKGYDGNWDGEGYGSGGGYGGKGGGGEGGDQSQGTAGVSFVHVLNLRDGWAYCAGLPRALWGRPASAMAMAPSPTGRELYIVDSTRGVVVEMNTNTLRIHRTAHLDLSGAGGERTSAVTSRDGERLFIGSAMDGSAVYEIDVDSMEVVERWTMPAAVSGLALSSDGARLYAALSDRVAVLDSSTGEELTTLSFGGASILHVATP